MSDLFIEDTHHLRAAKGWVELGNHIEAYHELEKICPSNRFAPDVLEVRWQIYTMAGRHDCALPVAQALVKAAPDRYCGWIWVAHSLNESGRTQEAVDSLLPAASKFPALGIIPFHIACHYAALGRLHEAKVWLQCAFASPEAKQLKQKARPETEGALGANWMPLRRCSRSLNNSQNGALILKNAMIGKMLKINSTAAIPAPQAAPLSLSLRLMQ